MSDNAVAAPSQPWTRADLVVLGGLAGVVRNDGAMIPALNGGIDG